MKRKKYALRTGVNPKTVWFYFIALAVFFIFFINRTQIYRSLPQSQSADFNNVFVTKVIDGDTVVLANRQRVRLIGIDTPEYNESDKLFRDASRSGLKPESIRALGRKSYFFTRDLCEGKYVRLEFGPDRYDKYGRILAFIFLPDGRMVNEEVLANGYALPLLRFAFRQEYRDRFVSAYNKARINNRGLWTQKPGLAQLERAYK